MVGTSFKIGSKMHSPKYVYSTLPQTRLRAFRVRNGEMKPLASNDLTSGAPPSRRFTSMLCSIYPLIMPNTDPSPQYCTPELRDVPNMGERSLGKPDSPASMPPIAATPTTSASRSGAGTPAMSTSSPAQPSHSEPQAQPRPLAKKHDNLKPPAPGTGWANSWRQAIWEKWRWGVLIALAVVVSRLSSSV